MIFICQEENSFVQTMAPRVTNFTICYGHSLELSLNVTSIFPSDKEQG